ncbi:MAG TPA: hypothetical protein VF097_08320 [Actinomycetota bacterium]
MRPIERLAAEWSAAEERITSLVMTRPEAYERHLRAARLVADALSEVGSREELVATFEEGEALAERVLHETGYPPDEVSASQVAGAGFAIRYRELVRELARAEAADRIREARRRGDAWVVVEEQGHADAPMPGLYRRLEMRLADGAGLHAFVDEDPGTGAPRFGAERVPLDPETGDATGDPSDRRMFGQREEWERHVRAIREGGPS